MGQLQSLIYKIAPPVLPKVVLRESLFELLDRKAHYSATWISAMAGAGKTTLVASYIEHKRLPFLWYRIDEGDSDPSTFFYYLSLAAKRASPGRRKPLPLLTPEYLPGAAVFSMRFFENLNARLSSPSFLVFDDFQNVEQFTLFQEVFKNGLLKLSGDIHVLVSSRTDPPPAFTPMIANNRMRIIGSDKLRLNPEESKAIVRLETGKSLPTNAARQLYEKTGGWAAGLVLMAKNMTRYNLSTGNLTKIIPSEIFDYFSSEMFAKMADDVRNFLLKTAFLPQMTISMAKAVTGCPDADRILASLQRKNIFTEKSSDYPPTYRYHSLFHEFLISKATDGFEQIDIEKSKRHAAVVLSEAGMVEDAVGLFIELGDMPALIQAIRECAMTLIGQGRSGTLKRWLEKIPEDILAEHPWLLYWKGFSSRHSSAKNARLHFHSAFHRFAKQRDESGLLLSWAGIVESIVTEWNYFNELDSWIEWLEDWNRSGGSYPSEEVEARVAAGMMVALLIRKPESQSIGQWVKRAAALTRKSGDIDLYVQAIDWAMTYYAWIGRFDKVEIVRNESRNLAKSHKTLPAMVIHWKWIDISTRLCTMTNADSILAEVEDSIELVHKTGLYTWEHKFLMPGIFAALLQRQFTTANTFLKRFEAILDQAHYHGHTIYHHFAGLNRLLTGDASQALAHAQTALRISEETGYVFPSILCRIQLAYVLHLRDASDEAVETLRPAYDVARRTKSAALEFMCLMVKAKIAYDQADEKQGLSTLSQALVMGRKHNFLNMVWWWHPGLWSYLCAQALANGIETDYVKKLIRVHNLVPEPRFSATGNWPWSLKVQTFESFQIIKNETAVRFNGKVQKRPIELLTLLIAKGGRSVPAAMITDTLWPDADGDMAYSAFTTTLNRLRKLVDAKDAIHFSNGNVSINPQYIWVDIHAFKETLKNASSLRAEGREREAIDLYENAIKSYRGNFLANESAKPWIIPTRERLKSMLLDAVKKAGRYREAAAEFNTAIRWYRKGISVDNLEEYFYQRLMVCYDRQGRYAEAVRVYERCRDELRTRLNVPPARETEEIYRRIRQSGATFGDDGTQLDPT